MNKLNQNRKKNSKPDRLEYLDQLVVEFQKTNSKDAKEQILANLANFAYDPFNYNFFRQLSIIDLFLDHLDDENETLVKFAIGGLCNLSLDPINKEYILKIKGVARIEVLLNHNNLDVVLSSLTTLMNLVTPESKPEITKREITDHIILLSNSSNARIKNLATVFLEDYCSFTQGQENSLPSTSKDILETSLSTS